MTAFAMPGAAGFVEVERPGPGLRGKSRSRSRSLASHRSATSSADPQTVRPILLLPRIPADVAALNRPEPWGRGVREG